MENLQALAAAMGKNRYCVVLTGAGASTESGLPDFRSGTGIWRGVDPMRVASLSALLGNPVEFYQFYRQRLSRLGGARPNPTHLALAALEQAGYVHCLITQNVDGLHQAAGQRYVIEAHGNLREAHCLDCGAVYPIGRLDVEVRSPADIPRCDRCQGYLKPGVVLFEEALPARAIDQAFREARRANLFLVVGSSLEVGPVNLLPRKALAAGARLAILNLAPTDLDDLATWLLRGKSGELLPALADILRVTLPGR